MSGERVLLSASFPSGERGREVAPYDVNQIADASVHIGRALLRADYEIVFGAHPTISPLMLSIAAERNTTGRIHIHQSRWFEGEIPADTMRLHEMGFGDFVWHQRGADRDESLRRMRRAMAESLNAAVFIGGMSGITEEAEIALSVGARCFAITGPGGAARRLANNSSITALDGPKYPEIAARIVEQIGGSRLDD